MSLNQGYMNLTVSNDKILYGFIKMKINRREFLKTLAALATVPALSGLNLEEEKVVDLAWNGLVEDRFVFEVGESGYLKIPGFVQPEIRFDLYDINPDSIKSLSDLKGLLAQYDRRPYDLHPIEGLLDEAYEEFFESEVQEAEFTDDSDDADEWPDCFDAQDEDLLKRWSTRIGDDEFIEDVRTRIEEWLNDPPEWEYEFNFFDNPGTAEIDGYRFFSNAELKLANELGVEIVEGQYPGDDFRGARMSISVEEANEICKAKGIPLRFVEADAEE